MVVAGSFRFPGFYIIYGLNDGSCHRCMSSAWATDLSCFGMTPVTSAENHDGKTRHLYQVVNTSRKKHEVPIEPYIISGTGEGGRFVCFGPMHGEYEDRSQTWEEIFEFLNTKFTVGRGTMMMKVKVSGEGRTVIVVGWTERHMPYPAST